MEVGKPAIASDGNRFAIEVIVLVYVSGIGLIILVGVIGGDAIAGLTYPLAVCVVDVAFGGQAGDTDGT